MTPPLPHSHDPERGAVAIEFALSVIILITIVFGCIGVVMGFYTYEVINQYARDASRYAIVHGSGCIIQAGPNNGQSCNLNLNGNAAAGNFLKTNYLNNQIYPGINGNNLQVQVNYGPAPGAGPCGNCDGAGDQVSVSIAYPFLYNIPFVPQRFITMHGTSTMVISQ